tara:strand:+ start:743 stop:937 length:195 start_codon:yes stop_codon:yes gene_type:complete
MSISWKIYQPYQILSGSEYQTYSSGSEGFFSSSFIEGEMVYCDDTDEAYMFSGSAWVVSPHGRT